MLGNTLTRRGGPLLGLVHIGSHLISQSRHDKVLPNLGKREKEGDEKVRLGDGYVLQIGSGRLKGWLE